VTLSRDTCQRPVVSVKKNHTALKCILESNCITLHLEGVPMYRTLHNITIKIEAKEMIRVCTHPIPYSPAQMTFCENQLEIDSELLVETYNCLRGRRRDRMR
jgi:hypothetical protein